MGSNTEIQSTQSLNIATRQAYGEALLELGAIHDDLVVLDADLSGSTGTGKFAKAYPDRFFNMGIAEQNMISTAAGLAAMGLKPFASSFAMFALGRAWEQFRNSVAHNHLPVRVAASHAGISLGQDGASHQIIEDFALARAIPELSVFVPADATETKALIAALIDYPKPAYIRLSRPPAPVLARSSGYKFEIGRAEVLRSGSDITIVALGLMVFRALEAASVLASEGIEAEVLNLSCLKPFPLADILASLNKTNCLVVAEEHNRIGGANELIASNALCHLGQFCPMEVVAIEDRFGQSGDYEELFALYGLTAEHICVAARRVIGRRSLSSL